MLADVPGVNPGWPFSVGPQRQKQQQSPRTSCLFATIESRIAKKRRYAFFRFRLDTDCVRSGGMPDTQAGGVYFLAFALCSPFDRIQVDEGWAQ